MGNDAKELQQVITTWSGTHENTESPNYSLREHLHLVDFLDKDIILNNVKKAMDESMAASDLSEVKRMVMYYPLKPEEDGITTDDYIKVNNNILSTSNFFSFESKRLWGPRADSPRVHSGLPKVNPQSKRFAPGEMVQFFRSGRYNPYTRNDSENPDVVSTGMRQRVVKLSRLYSNTLPFYSEMNNKPINLETKINELRDNAENDLNKEAQIKIEPTVIDGRIRSERPNHMYNIHYTIT